MLICLLTSVIYPFGFALFKAIDLLPLIAVRNLLWLAVCALWLVRCASRKALETSAASVLPRAEAFANSLSFDPSLGSAAY